MTRRICVITAGHLSTCPRMVKAADALTRAGHRVRVVSTRHHAWAEDADARLAEGRGWARWQVVNYDRASARRTYTWSGVRRRAALAACTPWTAARVPLGIAARAYSRVHSELVAAALAEPCDLFYGGTTGALAAAGEAASRANVPFALDLEDFHSAEQQGSDAEVINALASRIERELLPRAAALTAAGRAIRDEYEHCYRVDPTSVNNVFPLPSIAPAIEPRRVGDPLRLYWFSQTIGPQRGLEEVVAAVGHAGVPAELHLRGRACEGYTARLRRMAAAAAPSLQVFAHEPIGADTVVDSCRPYDIGLAVEQPLVRSRALCLTNKALTYPLAGLALVVTSTAGQQPFAADLGEGALCYEPGNVAALADGLTRWFADPLRHASARRAAWAAAVRRWHWEHPSERDALVGRIEAALA
jgi:hypothetical protein